MKRLAIIGAADLGIQFLNLAKTTQKYEVVGFVDDTVKGEFYGLKIIGKIDELKKLYKQKLFDCVIIAIGFQHLDAKQKIFETLMNKIPFATLIHPSCTIDSSAKINSGCAIYAGTVIDMNVSIGHNTIINLNCTIAHDTSIGEHSFLAPNVSIAGFVSVGKKNMLGINTTIIDYVKMGNKIKTGGGTVVIKELEEPGLYVGNPAIFIR